MDPCGDLSDRSLDHGALARHFNEVGDLECALKQRIADDGKSSVCNE